MSQTAYNLLMGTGFAGMKADSAFDLVESIIAYNAINFGRGLASYKGETDVEMAKRDVATVTYSADFVASNKVNLTINGVAMAEVTFATDHATTAAAVLAAIQAVSTVYSATKDGAGRVFTIRTKGTVATITGAVTAGGSQATTTVESTTASATNMVFKGISVHRHNESGAYAAKDIVDVIRQGRVWIETSGTVAVDQTAYVDLSDGLGKFTATSTNNLATGGVFKSAVTGAGLAVVEINLP